MAVRRSEVVQLQRSVDRRLHRVIGSKRLQVTVGCRWCREQTAYDAIFRGVVLCRDCYQSKAGEPWYKMIWTPSNFELNGRWRMFFVGTDPNHMCVWTATTGVVGRYEEHETNENCTSPVPFVREGPVYIKMTRRENEGWLSVAFPPGTMYPVELFMTRLPNLPWPTKEPCSHGLLGKNFLNMYYYSCGERGLRVARGGTVEIQEVANGGFGISGPSAGGAVLTSLESSDLTAQEVADLIARQRGGRPCAGCPE